MKLITNRFNCIIALLIGIVLVSCVQWGYSGGPRYQLVRTEKVFVQTRLQKLISLDSARQKLSIYIYDNNRLFSTKIITGENVQQSSYILPDSVVAFSKTKPINLLLIIDDKSHYTIDLRPEDWTTRDTVYGFYKQFER